jgi:hypothetical protein
MPFPMASNVSAAFAEQPIATTADDQRKAEEGR